MPTDLDEIQIFHAVATTGSITAAARALGLPKSTVSRRLSRHEERLGLKLFNKTTRRMVLTEMGLAYLERAQSLNREIVETEAFLELVTSNLAGTLRISATAAIATYWLAGFLVDFSQQHPELTLSLDLTGRRVDLIGERYDVAIRLGRMHSSDLVVRRFAYVDRALFAAPGYLAAAGRPERIEDLPNFRFVLLEAFTHPPQLEFVSGRRTVTVPTPGNIVSNSLGVVKGLVVAGGGIGTIPKRMVVDDLAAGRLVRLLPEWEVQPAEISYVIPAKKLLPAKTRSFIDALTAHFARHHALAGEPRDS